MPSMKQKKTFFSSDTHYGHNNILKYCNRPFVDIEEHDGKLIANWNSVVGPEDEVYHLGDFAMGKTPSPSYLNRLNGIKHLVWGNHDSNQTRALPGWTSSQPYLEIILEKQFIVLCHYKFDVFNKSHHGAIQFYGHSHGSMPGNDQQLDVGVDCWNYMPVTLEEIKARLRTLPPYRNKDHHGRRDEM